MREVAVRVHVDHVRRPGRVQANVDPRVVAQLQSLERPACRLGHSLVQISREYARDRLGAGIFDRCLHPLPFERHDAGPIGGETGKIYLVERQHLGLSLWLSQQ